MSRESAGRQRISVPMTQAEINVITRAAAKNRQTPPEFILEASLTYAQALEALRDQFSNLLYKRMVNRPVIRPGGWCARCGKSVGTGNRSGFCRECQRAFSLEVLRKRYGEQDRQRPMPGEGEV